ncbi:hypothetical protein Anas_05475 [Armadillidium nasatum]|uniref:Zasp-like motif domain-containing protein n=1 Tax=Armadillidium nasatum TaxID=96803 RepID=A0A5N5SQE2_9CRUS|nr:hypothetical protein Anas_05475 [Armadillidium nasatum]
MNQQMSSTHQTSSSRVIPGGGVFQTTSKVYESRQEYQYEQQYGGNYQTQPKSLPTQQDYSVQQQFHQQHNIQRPFNEFQVPIQTGYQQNLQQQQTFKSQGFTGQSKFQRPQQDQFSNAPNVQYQNIPSQTQGQFVPQSHARFQTPQSTPQTKPINIPQGNQPLSSDQKQARFPGNKQFTPTKQFQPMFQKGNPDLQQSQQPAEWPPKNEGGPNLTTTYPSGFKLKEEAPMDNTSGIPVVPSQPAFKITQPMKVKGDDKWPPKKYAEDITQEQVREFVKPKKSNRDYSEFFAQNALPNSYPAYRAPPGTQHRGVDE